MSICVSYSKDTGFYETLIWEYFILDTAPRSGLHVFSTQYNIERYEQLLITVI